MLVTQYGLQWTYKTKDISLLQHLIQNNEPWTGFCRTWGNQFIWIRCNWAGTYWKHAGQFCVCVFVSCISYRMPRILVKFIQNWGWETLICPLIEYDIGILISKVIHWSAFIFNTILKQEIVCFASRFICSILYQKGTKQVFNFIAAST